MNFKNLVRLSFLSVIAYYTWNHFSSKESNAPIVQAKKKLIQIKKPRTLITKTEIFNNEVSTAANQTDPNSDLFEDISLELIESSFQSQTHTFFTGSMELSKGQILSLDINLNSDISINLHSLTLEGNTFIYELNGEEHRGLVYQVDKDSYMLSFTTGLMEGHRFNFKAKTNKEEDIEIESAIVDYENNEETQFNEAAQLDESFQQEAILHEEIIIDDTNSFNFNQDS